MVPPEMTLIWAEAVAEWPAVRGHRLHKIRHAAETALRHLARPVDVVGHGLDAPPVVRHFLLDVEVVDEPVLVELAARHQVLRARRRTRHGKNRARRNRCRCACSG